MALQVAERAVVRHDLEAVAQRLEAAAGPVAAVRALADDVAQQRAAVGVGQRGDRRAGALLARARGLEQQRREQLLLVAVHVDERHGWARVGGVGVLEPEPRRPALARRAPVSQVAGPGAAAVGTLDA
jgi:hypothetical protein